MVSGNLSFWKKRGKSFMTVSEHKKICITRFSDYNYIIIVIDTDKRRNIMYENPYNLKKLTLRLEAGTSPETMDLTDKPHRFEFVFGIGRNGLTAFESFLSQTPDEKETVFKIHRRKIHETFEHLDIPFLCAPNLPETFYLKSTVENTTPIESREIVKQLAEMTSCGCSCCGH